MVVLHFVQVIDLILSSQPEALVRTSADQINLVVDACFKIKQQNLVDHLARALKKIYVLYSPASVTNPAKVGLPFVTRSHWLYIPLHAWRSHA